MRTPLRVGAIAGAAALSLVLAACDSGTSSDSGSMPGMHHSSSSPSATPSASAPVDTQHDAADVSFTQDMIVHHTGAIEMARTATAQASTQPVKDLASRIEAAQTPEIDEMTGWLTAWGEPVSPAGPMAGMDHSSGSTSSGAVPSGTTSSSSTGGAMGMMTAAQMDQLESATGTGFDRMFLTMMTTHHQGAIAMAKTEQANGSNPQAIALARSIQASQTAEVTEMAQMLTSLGS